MLARARRAGCRLLYHDAEPDLPDTLRELAYDARTTLTLAIALAGWPLIRSKHDWDRTRTFDSGNYAYWRETLRAIGLNGLVAIVPPGAVFTLPVPADLVPTDQQARDLTERIPPQPDPAPRFTSVCVARCIVGGSPTGGPQPTFGAAVATGAVTSDEDTCEELYFNDFTTGPVGSEWSGQLASVTSHQLDPPFLTTLIHPLETAVND